MKKRRMEITVEKTWLVFRRSCSLPAVLCDRCPKPSAMLPPEEAAPITGVNVRELYRWAEAGLIHFTEVQDGALTRLLVCLDSASSTNSTEGK